MRQLIRIAHSPDSDDALMFHALANGKLDTGNFDFEHILQDIETLNRCALEGTYEVTAVSIHAFAYLADRYLLLPHGASMGDRYGPRIVAARPLRPEDLLHCTVGVPGTMTSAFLVLNLFLPGVRTTVIRFDQIIPAVRQGTVDAGLLIHEGQLTYRDAGLHLVQDLGEWWHGQTGLPLPLGGNAIRRDLGPQTIRAVSRLLLESIRYALSHRQEALAYALRFARGTEPGLADQFIGMYVNDYTLDYGPRGRQAVREFLDRGHKAGIIPQPAKVEFADE
jgi:1,4-dihydroxy-6-naphthoate synthase